MSNRLMTEKNLLIAQEVVNIGQQINRTPAQVALNWVRQLQEKCVIGPILGARTETQIKDNLGILDFKLTNNQIEKLNEISKISSKHLF